MSDSVTIDAKEEIEAVVRALREQHGLIDGELSLALAKVIHRFQMDSQCQWGNAYFRCDICGDVRDCTGEEDWDDFCVVMCECETELNGDDLRISEGWVGRV